MGIQVKNHVIKRNGEEVPFQLDKIINAIKSANKEVERIHQLNEYQILAVADTIGQKVNEYRHAVNVEDIQDMVETGIMEMRGYEVAQKYVRYRYKRELTRKSNTTDNGILALIEHMNEEVNQENSNKNPDDQFYTERLHGRRSQQRSYPDVCSFRKRLCRRTKQESSTSMILIILHRKNITVI